LERLLNRAATNDGEVLTKALAAQLGQDRVSGDGDLRALVSQDIWSVGPSQAARVIAPEDTQALSAALKAVALSGGSIAVRGGGMSYSGGYLPQDDAATTIDMRRMNRVLLIDSEAMTVTVQAGCTWKTLHEALQPLGLRTPFWGPLSGLLATVGGAVSQEAILFGAGRYGCASRSVLALTVVLANGEVLRTAGGGERGASPFFRQCGPDLTGLFCGDCGAFGVKAEVVLHLIPAPKAEAQVSFAFPDRWTCVAAISSIARSGLASTLFAFDPVLARAQVRRVTARAAICDLAAVAASSGGWGRGVVDSAAVAIPARGAMSARGSEAQGYLLHLTCEGRSQAAVDADLAEVRAAVEVAGGRDIDNSLPKVLAARPFRPLNSVLGAGGERWAPVHGVVSLADAQAACASVEALFAERAAAFAAAKVEVGLMLNVISNHAFVIEAAFTWPGRRTAIHEAVIEPEVLARMPSPAEDPRAAALVAEGRAAFIDALASFSAAHLQIGRYYPYRSTRDAASLALLDAAKAALDPKGRMSPGVLGFHQ
jgi:D-lactate dehydrogenase (cytochrome)